jgi:hypothetical protein
MSDDESGDSIPVEATTHPFDESVVLEPNDYDEAVQQAQDLLENSSSYTALIEIDEGVAIVTAAEDSELEGERHFAHIGTLLRDAAYDHDLSVVEAVKIALKLSDPSGWTDSGTRTLPGYLREKGEEREGDDGQ